MEKKDIRINDIYYPKSNNFVRDNTNFFVIRAIEAFIFYNLVNYLREKYPELKINDNLEILGSSILSYSSSSSLTSSNFLVINKS
jgi:hypothetical protein